jgi:hypothetical protein
VTIAGGGALTPATTVTPVTVSSQPAPFGFADWDVWFANADGTVDTQAGSHPYEATFSYDLNTAVNASDQRVLPGETRNIEVELPPGFVGNPTAVPQCTREELDNEACPDPSQIGTTQVRFADFPPQTFRVFNMVPPPGKPAEFAFTIENVNTLLDAAVRSGSDYGITTRVDHIAELEITSTIFTIWGVPGDKSHDRWRSVSAGGCTTECHALERPSQQPFLTLPTSCSGPQKVTIRATSWQKPDAKPVEEAVLLHDSNDNPSGFADCEHMGFAPAITISPDTAKADTPAGLTVEVKPSVGDLSNPNRWKAVSTYCRTTRPICNCWCRRQVKASS